MRSARARRVGARRDLAWSPPAVVREGRLDPVAVERTLAAQSEADRRALEHPFVDAIEIELELVTGVNRINHGLERPARGVIVVPRSADAAFAWAFDWRQLTNPQPHRQAWIDVVGGSMHARVVVF